MCSLKAADLTVSSNSCLVTIGLILMNWLGKLLVLPLVSFGGETSASTTPECFSHLRALVLDDTAPHQMNFLLPSSCRSGPWPFLPLTREAPLGVGSMPLS